MGPTAKNQRTIFVFVYSCSLTLTEVPIIYCTVCDYKIVYTANSKHLERIKALNIYRKIPCFYHCVHTYM